jgi:hypothetical protein
MIDTQPGDCWRACWRLRRGAWRRRRRRPQPRRLALLENRHTVTTSPEECFAVTTWIGWIWGTSALSRSCACAQCGGLLSPLAGSQPVSVRCRARAPTQVLYASTGVTQTVKSMMMSLANSTSQSATIRRFFAFLAIFFNPSTLASDFFLLFFSRPPWRAEKIIYAPRLSGTT